MRVFRLAFAGVLALAVPMAAHALPLGSSLAPAAPSATPNIVQVWGGCGGVGIPFPDTGANGEGDGLRHIVRRTATAAAGEARTAVGEIPIGAGACTAVGQVPTEFGVITARTGVIPNCSQFGG
jgi:hypothetical protein